MPRVSSAPGAFLDPNTWAANATAEAALFGLRMLAPNAASLLASEPAQPMANFPATPGKIPSTSDPRIGGAIGAAANIGMSLLPFPVAGLSVGTGRGILGLLRRVAPEASRTAPSLASRGVFIYNPPVKSPRPLSADYPSGAPVDAAGRLTADIEGRPLVAQRIIGRRILGGADEAVAPTELDAIAEKVLGHRPEVAAASSLPRKAVGAYDPNTRRTYVYRGLSDDTKSLVAAHEVSHGIDDLAGEFVAARRPKTIPIPKGAVNELKTVYNDLNNSYLASARRQNPDVAPKTVYWGTGVSPETAFGYSKKDAPFEYMAEAIRAYMADPNYLKTVAPKTAAAIREAVNSHPLLSKIIQFNTLGGLAALNGIDSAAPAIPKQQLPALSQ
jgi:hypothetical protein